MTKQEIEKAALEIMPCDENESIQTAFLRGQRRGAFIAGAEMVNSKQPYSKIDITGITNIVLKSISEFFSTGKKIPFSNTDELIKLWEESK